MKNNRTRSQIPLSEKRSQEKPDYDYKDLRADFTFNSELVPSQKPLDKLLGWLRLKRVGPLIIIIVLLGLAWLCSLGPLAPRLESLLSQRISMALKSTSTFTPTETPSHPSTATNSPIATLRPTATATPKPTRTVTNTATPTSSAPTETPSPTSPLETCIASNAITKEDKGKNLCVYGYVQGTTIKNDIFYIFVEQKPNTFYFVSYNRTWDLKNGSCVYATGEIETVVGIPIMEVNYKIPLEFCP